MVAFNFENGNIDISCIDYESVYIHNYTLLKRFLNMKIMEGCSDNTIKTYNKYLAIFIESMVKRVEDVDTSLLKDYLIEYKISRPINNTSLDSIRRCLCSFYSFLEDEDYILKNPAKKLRKIKNEKIIRHPFSEDDLCKLKDACTNIRDLSLIDFLETSGVRVSELCNLNISDINFDERECIVYEKGRKERIVYFSSQCKVHLLKYLSTRIDDNPALFVNSISLRAQRVSRGTVENLIHKISKRAGVEGAYPHRFRRTLATKLISRNVPIEQVQKLLGHSKIETTLIYAEVDQNNVKNSHRKYI